MYFKYFKKIKRRNESVFFENLTCEQTIFSTKLNVEMSAGKNADLLRKKYDFRWEVLDIIVSGKSSIDTNQGFLISDFE